MNKEEPERLVQLGKDKQKSIVKQKEEKEGIKMETKSKNEKRRKIDTPPNSLKDSNASSK